MNCGSDPVIIAYMLMVKIKNTLAFELSVLIPASPQKVYNAWLSSRSHAAFTGMEASISAEEGSAFSAFGNYISGKNISLVPGNRIVQSWRTTDFNEQEPDSTVDISLRETDGKTKLKLRHYNLPAGGMKYKQGWKDYYFETMKEYFSK